MCRSHSRAIKWKSWKAGLVGRKLGIDWCSWTCSRSGGPRPPGPCWEWGLTAGGEHQESERSFICRPALLLIARITAWTIPAPAPPARVHGKIVFHETGPWYQKAWGPLLSRIPTCDEGWAPVPWSIHWKQNSKLSLNFCLRRLGIHFEPSVVTQDCYQAENSSPGMSSTSVVVLGPRRWALL